MFFQYLFLNSTSQLKYADRRDWNTPDWGGVCIGVWECGEMGVRTLDLGLWTLDYFSIRIDETEPQAFVNSLGAAGNVQFLVNDLRVAGNSVCSKSQQLGNFRA